MNLRARACGTALASSLLVFAGLAQRLLLRKPQDALCAAASVTLNTPRGS